MRELSLFSGAGGGVLGSKLLGHRIIGYVEFDAYCQEILKQRIADGILDAAPIFGDIRKFISEGYAADYKGMVDIITAGFPCQPFSVAGKRGGENDARNMWPETLEVIRRVKPKFVFLENVPGLKSNPYFRKILRQISESRYDAKWTCLGADDIGANHRRKRLWILAYAQSRESRKPTKWKRRENFSGGSEEKYLAEPSSIYVERFKDGQEEGKSRRSSWWSVEPRVGRVVTGFPSRVDRLKALGNAQVPIQMAYAFSILSKGVIE